jgi:hypothetical protein
MFLKVLCPGSLSYVHDYQHSDNERLRRSGAICTGCLYNIIKWHELNSPRGVLRVSSRVDLEVSLLLLSFMIGLTDDL